MAVTRGELKQEYKDLYQSLQQITKEEQVPFWFLWSHIGQIAVMDNEDVMVDSCCYLTAAMGESLNAPYRISDIIAKELPENEELKKHFTVDNQIKNFGEYWKLAIKEGNTSDLAILLSVLNVIYKEILPKCEKSIEQYIEQCPARYKSRGIDVAMQKKQYRKERKLCKDAMLALQTSIDVLNMIGTETTEA